jgi:hypothetical protein
MEFFYPLGANLYLDRIQLRNPPPHSAIEGEGKVETYKKNRVNLSLQCPFLLPSVPWVE